jgi:hypothetical protein
MRNIRFIALIIVALTEYPSAFSQSGESPARTVIINQNEKRILSQPVETESLPRITWLVPGSNSENTDFPLLEISGIVKSETRLTGLKLLINGLVLSDNKTFLIIPAENQKEYRISRSIALTEGINELIIEARNEKGASLSLPRSISYSIARIDESYSEKRLALVIGNSNYIYGNFLPNPVNDANAISQALAEVGFTVLKYLNTDQKMLNRALDEFGEKLKNYTVGLFYYAGHGLQVKGNNYLGAGRCCP